MKTCLRGFSYKYLIPSDCRAREALASLLIGTDSQEPYVLANTMHGCGQRV